MLNKNELWFAAVMGGGLLLISIAQAGSELAGWGNTPIEKFYLIGLVVFALLSSQILIRTTILNYGAGNVKVAIVALSLVCGVESFSFITTKLAIQGRAHAAAASENTSSREFKTAAKNERRYERQLQQLERSYNDTPANQSTARNRIAQDIKAKNQQLLAAQRITGTVNTSVTGSIIGSRFVILVAALQSLIPIVINLSTMMIAGNRSSSRSQRPARSQQPGKSQRPMSAVA